MRLDNAKLGEFPACRKVFRVRSPERTSTTMKLLIDPLDQLRLQRGAEHLHGLGPRAVAEFQAELARRIGGMPAILGLLAEYQALSPSMVRAAGGHRFPGRPMHVVAGSEA